MKNIIKITLIAVLALGLNTGQAHAGDDAAAAIGGFVVGMITGAILDDHHDDRVRVSVHSGRRGHWETRRVKVWNPGYWDVRIDRCGDRVRVWRSGHYTYRTDRVWVSYRGGHRGHDRGCGHRDGRCDRGCGNRGHDRDYDRDRDHDRHYDRDRDHHRDRKFKNRKERWYRG